MIDNSIELEKQLMLNEKDQNIACILNSILAKDQISYNEIAKNTNLSLSTISRVVAIFKKKKIIIDKGKDVTSLGRRPRLICFNKNYGNVIHINILSNSITGYCLDLNGKVLDENEGNYEKSISLEELLDVIKNVYKALLKSNTNILAICVSFPGMVNEKEQLIFKAPDIPQINSKKAYSLIKNLFEIPVIIKRCTELSAIGESIGAYSDCSNLVFIDITNSSSIGAGIIINGKIYNGSNNYAGEIGDMLFGNSNCLNGYKEEHSGYFESKANLNVLYSQLNHEMEKGRAGTLRKIMVERKSKKLTLDLIEEAVEKSDIDVWEIYSETLKLWAMAIINLYCSIDPEVVILGGTISESNETTLKHIKKYVQVGIKRDTNICFNRAGDEALITGSVYLLRQYVLNEIILNEVV